MTTPRAGASDQNATVAAGFLGWMLDAFDFFLVVMTLTAIGKDFGKSDAARSRSPSPSGPSAHSSLASSPIATAAKSR